MPATFGKQTNRRRGGQPGNRNAAGHGAPRGNQNALKHGLYERLWYIEADRGRIIVSPRVGQLEYWRITGTELNALGALLYHADRVCRYVVFPRLGLRMVLYRPEEAASRVLLYRGRDGRWYRRIE